ncbi:uncharacterized protein containing a von Willebrand factor type A (vWA) domain [Hahella chejuensis KCTC 2396]|uniref:Uncharacterized protein containing a von Willebrand factor type A (VWA) domain n=1 Tax=Hahella chejuensis (strain KCTC 2396) TaxID=349521 RepID=Q2SIW4_HAHCH|nr:vWA domain-containing protein [Hahella chejuensis]ABC29410.1 uncharacterized protein containing a von Willebrand factor type A (vWA) domain [Hahella chejuensis KCTC 2396]
MTLLFRQILVCLCCSLMLWRVAAAQMELPPPADVRVLIDVSGSMKKNDPKNLRRPALNLVTELLPEGDSAGVWTFGQYVNELAPHQVVDPGWRRLAKDKAREISSTALYTNIGAALEKASEDFVEGKDYSNTHFILLTDGVVDISQKPGENVAERDRVLTQVLKRVAGFGAKIHTIALSRNADQMLLQRLSIGSNGINAIAENSEQLSRVFLQAFERAAPAEEVPLEDNAFDVDSSIEEFTALVFRAKENAETAIIEPTGKRFTEKDRPEYVKWFKEAGYDLITVQRPLEGEWKLDAELAPGSRVTVVSNLKMVVDPLPANFYAGDHLELKIGFFEDGELVRNRTFLDLVAVDVTIRTEDNKSGTKRISKESEPPADGVFRESITKLKQVGRYEVLVQADGRTFKRQSRQLITLNAPMAVDLEATGAGVDTRYKIVISPLSPNINEAKTSIIAKIKGPDGGNLIKSIPFTQETGRWELEVDATRGDGVYEVMLRVEGETRSGSAFRFEPDSVMAEFPRQEASPNEYRSLVNDSSVEQMNETLVEEAAKAPEPPKQPEENAIAPPITPEMQDQAAAEQQDAVVQEESGTNAMLWIIIAAGGASILLLAVGGGYWIYRKRRIEKEVREPVDTTKLDDSDDVPSLEESGHDLEDEIEQLEQPIDVAEEPSMMSEADDMEFGMEEEAEPKKEEDAEPPMSSSDSEETDAEALADEILASNEKAKDMDDEFNLEDFDISDTDDLPAGSEDEDKK